MLKALFDLLEYEDLTPDLKLLCDTTDLETVKKLILNFKGFAFYIPKFVTFRSLVFRYIQAQPREVSINRIASNLTCSDAYLRSVLFENTGVYHRQFNDD